MQREGHEKMSRDLNLKDSLIPNEREMLEMMNCWLREKELIEESLSEKKVLSLVHYFQLQPLHTEKPGLLVTSILSEVCLLILLKICHSKEQFHSCSSERQMTKKKDCCCHETEKVSGYNQWLLLQQN